jgi:hypothetical protein
MVAVTIFVFWERRGKIEIGDTGLAFYRQWGIEVAWERRHGPDRLLPTMWSGGSSSAMRGTQNLA